METVYIETTVVSYLVANQSLWEIYLMEPNPILEEVWRIKDELAREAGDDLHRLCENTRRWAAEHPYSGPVVGDAQELRRLAAEYGLRHPVSSAMTLNDVPPCKE